MTLQEQLFYVLRMAVKEKKTVTDELFDIPALTIEAERHGVQGMLYFGLVAAGADKQDPQMRALFRSVGHDIFVTENQFDEVQAVLAAFERDGIAYMPLKGMVLRDIYPSPDMRAMGDMDILIKTAQFPQIDAVMRALGFTFDKESAHEYIWKNNFLTLEFHKGLFASYETDLYALFGDGWQLAKPTEQSCRFVLSPEDQFIYVFLHFLKHYRNSGIGLRHLTDIVVLLHKGDITDFAYIEQRLKKLGVLKFYRHVLDAVSAWLEDAPATPQAAAILQTVYTNGKYGTAASSDTADLERTAHSVKSARFWYVWSLLFPSGRRMQLQYPFLKKMPFLTVCMWPVRWLDILLHRRQVLEKRVQALQTVSLEDIENKRNALQFVDLKPPSEIIR